MLFRRKPTPAAPPAAAADPAHRAIEIAISYHARSKHHLHRYAPALGYLDWDSQPDPFRRYEGAALHALPRPTHDRTPPFEALWEPGAPAPAPLGAASLSEFFYFSLALSAWKRIETAHWSLRVNPSSGNLHPTEGYAVLPPLGDLGAPAGVFHYAPREHGLERRASLPPAGWSALAAAFALPPGGFLLALTSVPWRESWKYGERAFRYCQHDAGHAIAALRLAAALQGWTLEALPAFPDDALAALLGLDRAADFAPGEPEVPELLAVVRPGPRRTEAAPAPHAAVPTSLPAGWADGAQWSGAANVLSSAHHDWEVIDAVDAACRKSAAWCAGPGRDFAGAGASTTTAANGALSGATSAPTGGANPLVRTVRCAATAGTILRQRRSAVAMDGRTSLDAAAFHAMLAALLPDGGRPPWDAIAGPPLVHLGLFVHRVRDVAPGLYALVRRPGALDGLRAAMNPRFLWQRPPGAPEALPLYLLAEGNVQGLATQVSCGQDIAGQSAFSLGMLAEFEPALARYGAPVYRHLFWETGAIGQVLYLQAEAAGVRSTGIGCFFDDPAHEAFGLRGREFQSLYHFTVGGAVEDTRLTTEPAYPPPALA